MIVEEFLGSRRINFTRIVHPETREPEELAESLHVPPEDVARTVLLKHGDGFVVAMLPASCDLDMEKAKKMLAHDDLELADEDEVADHYSDCERGIVLPFGSYYGMTTIVDRSLLAKGRDIYFEGNTHREAFRIAYSEFQQIEQPMIGDIASDEGCRLRKLERPPHF